ncbi:MAG: spore maturation protein [Clostridia bacterium]
MANYFIPVLIIIVLVICIIKKVSAYNAFVEGAKQSLSLSFSLYPYLSAIFIAVALMKASGLDVLLTDLTSPLFNLLGIPTELVNLIILRPFTGSGSLALLSDIYAKYGVDSYVSRCASIIMGSTETVFYVSALYFATARVGRTAKVVLIALFCSFIGCILACLLCRIM